jgi:hypothetical protein
MKLRIAFKILKRDSDDHPIPPRLLVRATKRWHKWIRNHVNHDSHNHPSRRDLRYSIHKTRRCQPIAELKRLWHARVSLKEAGACVPEVIVAGDWIPGDPRIIHRSIEPHPR